MTAAYYNECDPYAAAWLRNLIAAGHIAAGDIDERSIEDVRPDDLRGYTQCHFFAGVGVWSYALRLAGWPDDRSVWTGSCPCQPFSAAGKGTGFADERHLWPAFHHLIQQCRPAIVFGEQVASKDADPWIDLVQDDLEALGYAVGAVPFPSAGVGAPHIRDRLYWVADTANQRQHGRRADHHEHGRFAQAVAELLDTEHHTESCGGFSGVAHADMPIAEQFAGQRTRPGEAPGAGAYGEPDGRGELAQGQPDASPTNGYWRDADWLFCRDGKWRPVEPGTFPLAHGASARVGRLRAYGNAIVPQVAAEFIGAFINTRPPECFERWTQPCATRVRVKND